MKAKYDEIVDFAGIEAFMDLPVKNYSTGMYARLAFAVAISVDPEILLIDEVLSVGDAEFQAKCYDRISEFRAQGRTIVIVSHSLDSIRTLCDHAVWLEKGVIRSIGTSDDVVSTYLADIHSAEFHQDGETIAAADRWGSRQIEITDVAIDAGSAKVDEAVRTFQSMSIRVAFEVNKPLKDPREFVCGVAVYRADTQEIVFGQNTAQEHVDFVLRVDRGVIQIEFDQLPLVPGSYLLSVGLCDRSYQHVYDWHERRYSFTVLKNPKINAGFGVVQVEAAWSLSPSPEEAKVGSSSTSDRIQGDRFGS